MNRKRIFFAIAIMASVTLFLTEEKVAAQRDGDLRAGDAPPIREQCVIENIPRFEIRASTSSTILWLAESGSKVQKGDLVFRFDSSKLEDQLQQQKISYETAAAESIKSRAQLDFIKRQSQSVMSAASKRLQAAETALKSFAGPEGIAKTEIKQAEAELAAAEEKLKFLEAARAAGAVQNRLQLIDARLEISTIKQSIGSLKKNGHPAKLAELEAIVATREADMDEIKSKFEAELAGIEAQMEGAKSALRIEKLKLEKIQKQIERCAVQAPDDGHLLIQNSGRNSIEIGSLVRENQVIARIVDGDSFRARVLVNESRIAKIKEGQVVTVMVGALPSKQFKGVVANISRFPERTTFLDSDVKKYAVTVTLSKSSDQLRHGMTAMAEISLKQERP